MIKTLRQSTSSLLQSEIRKLIPGYLALSGISVFISILVLVPPLYMIQISDRVLLSKNYTTLFFLSVIAIFLVIVWAALEFLRSKTLQRLAISLDKNVGEPLFNKMHDGASPSGGVSRTALLADFNTLRETLAGPLIAAIIDTALSPIFLVVLFLIHPLFGVWALASLVVIAGLSISNQMLVIADSRRAQDCSLREFEFASAVARSSDTARVMGMLPGLTRRWHTIHLAMLGWQASAQTKAAAVMSLIRFLRMSQQIFVLAIGAVLFIERQIGAGSMFAAMIIVTRGLGPVEQVFASWRSMSNARGAFDRLNEVLATQHVTARLSLPRPSGKLVVSRVSVAPPGGERFVLSDVSFATPAGRVIGVVGSSGAGKSCLSRTLVGAWQPSRGKVTLDGHELSHWTPQELGRHIGYMPQEVELLPGTVAENISRFYDPEHEHAEAVLDAASVAGVQDLIQSLPEGYNTKVGPGGHVLSGGQRQRIALARAVYGNPALVVLDEPNSNLDAVGEEALGQAIQALRENGATVVIVTHKLSMLIYCDDVLVLHEGSVHVFGSREDIMRRLPPQRMTALRAVESH